MLELYEFNDSSSSSLTESDSEDKVQISVTKTKASKGKQGQAPKGEAQDVPFVDPFPDFQWMTTEEPHRSRRMAILKAHPEVSMTTFRW